ncbi:MULTISPECIES: P-loop NTPase fold protein [unclassified Comamonas]|uniref:KAP family P-loop NTPase fold protein n=1 Tax=unclassified Comamonas TaxID=2638500 RepID=UPI001FA78CB4|nr:MULTISPECIES: P-loop NTPase fold protein [unclassified Comamonas]UNV89533.1 KAP family NTPase [Comamonas sp. 7D-2evo1]UNV97168.1 KAP family NTPase [Comamonas sp. 7D-2]UNV99178.1 KAP family NTPase [Comamonas sp. 7D-2evo2]
MDLSADTVFTNIWARDKLDRKGYADFLYKVIESAKTSEAEDNALIFAIDGEWGTGKSFFIDCWIEDLRAKGHLVSRFDAWKNDIVDEPLIGFLSHIYKDVGDWDNKKLIAVAGEKIKQSQKSILPLAKELVKGAAIKGLGYIVTDEVAKEVSKAIADSSEKVAEDQEKDEQSMSSMLIHRQLQAHNKNLQLIEEFKDKLSSVAQNLVSGSDRKQPVFIFIDELDRCRPDYAVRLLEVVKHIFNSKGICFISSVNIDQLQKSIKTIYGAEFGADQYLDRFFSHRLKLPTPSSASYINSLKIFKKIKDNKIRLDAKSSSIKSHVEVNYVKFYEHVCAAYRFDLRTINNIFSRLDICRSIIIGGDDNFFHDEILFLMICYFKANANKSFDPFIILSSSSMNFGDLEYFYYSSNFGAMTLRTSKVDNMFDAIRYINAKEKDPRGRYQVKDDTYDILNTLELELGGDAKSLKLAKKRLMSYVDVCRMSGRLDN